ncbi:hypothetical protein LguiA_010703 [Lonicera macranthoides]
MKRLKSSDDLETYGEKGVSKDWGRRDDDSSLHRSSSHRGFYYKPENGKKGLSSSSSSRYDRLEDDRESSRSSRKRPDYDVESYDRRKGYDRYRDGGERGILSSSPRGGYGLDRIHRSESFSGSRRDFPKGFRSERDRSRREGSVSSWWRFGVGKDAADEGTKTGGDSAKGSRVTIDEIGKVLSPRLLRDAKSPAWSKDSGSRDAKSPAWSKDSGSRDAKSPAWSKDSGSRDAKSPAWSKDSGSDQSKSVEVKKSEDLQVESGSSSEMEEGELEPEPEPARVLEPVAENQAPVRLNSDQKELDNENPVEQAQLKECVSEEKAEVGQPETVQDVVKEVDELPACENTSINLAIESQDVIETTATANDGVKDKELSSESSEAKEDVSNALGPANEEQEEDKGTTNLEVKAENLDLPLPDKGVAGGDSTSVVALSLLTDEITQNFKDKGKSVAVSPNHTDFAEDGFRVRGEDDVEGPSTRGFELFFMDPVKKQEKASQSSLSKPKDEKLTLEPLELSLSLPNVLLPIGSQNAVQGPSSPSHARSIQSFASSFRTNSDGFTASMSFSGSHPFSHNPSCSLTQNEVDYEKSVGSRPIFQGLDQSTPSTWQAQPSNDRKNKEVPMYQRVLSNGHGSFQGIPNGQSPVLKIVEGSSRIPVGLDRQMSFRHQNESPAHSSGSQETGSEYSKDKKRVTREKNGVSSLHRTSNQDEKDQPLTGGADFVEPVITMLDSEPLHVTARRFNEMTTQSIACLKESVRDIILNPRKRWQLSAFQKTLQNRSDITMEMLLKSHRAQLEILVALKTGLQEFLHRNYEISSSDLAEIFLNQRCRNLTCKNLLPVDECDCKVCSQKNGFCSACMCLVCSKFDMASNTCSWVGCDVCLHWCHADCGLRESFIRNGRSASGGAQGTTEMQFHCVACDHPSEMFGFVKEVFQNFAEGWNAETFFKELEYVRKIFCASEDVRGKRMHEIAIRMLSRLGKKCDLQEVQSHIMGFLTESDSFKSGNTPIVSAKELPKKHTEKPINIIGGSSQEPVWLKSVYSEKSPLPEKLVGIHPGFDYDRIDLSNSDPQRSAKKEPVFDELESIVRIKHAEAKMFQARADDARREAEGLRRIALTKNEKIEEEYAGRIKKLHLAEAEEIRRRKLEELTNLERAHQEYFNMRTRMEADIKDLLLKMEVTKRNLAS